MTRDEEVSKVQKIYKKINELLVGETLSVGIEALQYSLACQLAVLLTDENQETIDHVLKCSHEEIEHLEKIMREDIKVGVDE